MKSNIGIAHFVRITSSHISLDGERVFFSEQENLETLLTSAYKDMQITYPKFYKMDLMCKLGFIAAELLYKNNVPSSLSAFQRGIIFQNHASSLATDQNFQASINDIASPALFVYTLPNIVMGELAIRHTLKGENTFFVSAEFNPTQLIDYTKQLFENNVLSEALIGYIECIDKQADVLLCLVEKNAYFPLESSFLLDQYQQTSALPK